jgi:hypothetical protein
MIHLGLSGAPRTRGRVIYLLLLYALVLDVGGRLGAFSGRRIGAGLCVAGLWVRLRLWSPTLRLCGSGRWLGAACLWVRTPSSGLQLRGSSLCGAAHGRNDCHYRDAWSGLFSAGGGIWLL